MRIATASKILVPTLAGLALATSVAFGRPSSQPVAVRPSVTVYEADREQVRLVRWAAGRFEGAGVEVPRVDVHFHRDSAGCGGHLGFARNGRVDVCTVLVNEMARRTLLHEMGHVWIDQNVSQATRERFLVLRGLRAWNASTDPWEDRGYEQGAEIMAWALGTTILTAQVPGNDPARLEAGFELLTGMQAPAVGSSRSFTEISQGSGQADQAANPPPVSLAIPKARSDAFGFVNGKIVKAAVNRNLDQFVSQVRVPFAEWVYASIRGTSR
jgi:hypothetical protein